MKKLFILSILLGSILAARAQGLTQTIRGNVVDMDSKSPLIGANVVLLKSEPFKGTITDLDGNFRLEDVPVGRQGIKVSFLGYKAITLSEISVISGKELILAVDMEETVVKDLSVVVKPKKRKDEPNNEMALISVRTFSIEETNRYAGSWGDPARMASNFAGVTGSNDQRNDIVVRGNSPVGVLWRLDGVEIPNPNHFSTSGASGGGISMLNNNLLTNSDFMTSAFAAEYGNAISGVFDLQMRKGNNEQREYIFQLGVNGFELGAEGPFSSKAKASYLINYRYSTLGVLDLIGALDFIGAVPDYQDLSFKVHVPNQKGYFSLFGMAGKSKIVFAAEADSTLWISTPENRYKEIAGSETGVVGLSNMYFFNDKTYLKTTLSSSLNTSFYSEEVYNKSYDLLPDFDTRFEEGRHVFSTLWNKKINSRHTIRAGAILTYNYFKIKTENWYYGPNLSNPTQEIWIDFDGNATLGQAYAQWKFKPLEKLTLNMGSHFMHFFLNDRQSVEPRFAAKWALSPKHALSAGVGLHSKQLPVGVYFGEIFLPSGAASHPNRGLDFARATHYVLGYDWHLGPDLRLKLETYYQELRSVPVDATARNSGSGLNAGADFENIISRVELKSTGTGENYGVEMTLEKFLSRNYFFLLTGSIFESKYRGSDRIQRNTAFNTNYSYNILGGKEFKVGREKNNVIGISSTVVNVGGLRYTPIDLQASILTQDNILIDSQAFSAQHPPYFRTDIRLSYRQNRPKFSHEIAIEAKNMFNTQNIFLQSYDSSTGKIETLYQTGLFPILLYRIEF